MEPFYTGMIGYYFLGASVVSCLLLFIQNKYLMVLVTILFVILQIVFTFYEYLHMNITEFDYFTPDALAIIFLVVLCIIAVPAVYHSHIYCNSKGENPKKSGLYFAAVVMLLASLSAVYLSNHIAVTWIFIELTTLSSSALIYHRRNTRSLEGTWKYLFVTSISITLVFIGILFLSLAVHEMGGSSLLYKDMFSSAHLLNPYWLKMAFLFILTGYSAKCALVPMYNAGIDAKDNAPSPAGALLSSVLMNAGFVGIFRFYEVVSPTPIFPWVNNILFTTGFLSIFVAAVYMLHVKNIKRMFAYSSVEHMGLVMIGLASGGIGRYAAILHVILHSLTKPTFFFQMGQVYRIFQSKSIFYVGDYFKYNPTGALAILFAFFVVTGMPPSGMFLSEFLIFRSLFESGNTILLSAVLLLLTMIIYSFGKIIFKLLFLKTSHFVEKDVEKISVFESLSQYILLGLVIYLGLNPPTELISMIQESISRLPK